MNNHLKSICLSLLIAALAPSNAFSQSTDEKIGAAMNVGDWFALDSIYAATPKDSINPYLEVLSRCLIGNRLNRPDVSIPAFKELLNSRQLDLDMLVQSVYMFGMDLSHEGHNTEAASMTKAVVTQTKQYLDSATVEGLSRAADRYAALAQYTPYQIEFPGDENPAVPFTIVPVGPKDKGSVHMHLSDSFINGLEADITFDTGAGVNMASPEMARRYNLVPMEGALITVAGMGKSTGYYAIAKELKIGNIIVKDVPFVVADMSSRNEEADAYFESFNLIVGSELMLQLKNLTIDFASSQITVAKEAQQRTGISPNLCFSSGMNLLTKGTILGAPVILCLDSGDAGFGSVDSDFYESHKEYVTAHGHLDKVRSAGVGGFDEVPCYYVPDMHVTLGGSTVTPAEFVVKLQPDATMDYQARIGLRTMLLFSKMHFNLVDFVLTTEY